MITITVRSRTYQESPEPRTAHPCHACDAQELCDEARQASVEVLGRGKTCVTRGTVYKEIEK